MKARGKISKNKSVVYIASRGGLVFNSWHNILIFGYVPACFVIQFSSITVSTKLSLQDFSAVLACLVIRTFEQFCKVGQFEGALVGMGWICSRFLYLYVTEVL